MRFSRSLLVALPVLSSALVLSSLPRHSLALDAKTETEAKALQKKAIEEDNLYAKYADAVAKLRAAITMCAGDKCSSKLRSTLYRDMGAMQHLAGSKDTGNASFREALKIDRTLELAVEYKSRALEEAWDAVKQSLAGPVGDQPKGDFEHSPFAEQLVRTPLAIYAEYGAGEKVTIVKLGYRGAGMSEFKSVELTKQGKGWLTILPCTIVTEGVFKYYLEGFDDEGNRVAGSGTRSRPYQIPIRSKIAGDIPTVPGLPAQKQCPDLGDCPPGMKGPACVDNTVPEKRADGASCESNDECKSAVCDKKENKCVAPKATYNRFWIGISGALDWVIVPSATQVCTVAVPSGAPVNTAGYYCTNADGSDFPTRKNTTENESIQAGKGNEVKGGVAMGNIRILASFDYALSPNWLVGMRAGYVAGTYPGQYGPRPFAPVHLEARGTYLFGNSLVSGGFAPYVFAGVGATETDTAVDVNVIMRDANANIAVRSVKAWAMAGPAFFALGAGVRYQFGSRFALLGAGKFTGAVGGPAGFLPVLTPELGMQVGF